MGHKVPEAGVARHGPPGLAGEVVLLAGCDLRREGFGNAAALDSNSAGQVYANFAWSTQNLYQNWW